LSTVWSSVVSGTHAAVAELRFVDVHARAAVLTWITVAMSSCNIIIIIIIIHSSSNTVTRPSCNTVSRSVSLRNSTYHL